MKISERRVRIGEIEIGLSNADNPLISNREMEVLNKKNRAKKLLGLSNIASLLREEKRELTGEFDYVSVDNLKKIDSEIFTEECAYTQLKWNEEMVGNNCYIYDSVLVQVFPNGNIIVHGGFGGSSVLRLEEWYGGIAPQIKAIKKAINNPRFVIERF